MVVSTRLATTVLALAALGAASSGCSSDESAANAPATAAAAGGASAGSGGRASSGAGGAAGGGSGAMGGAMSGGKGGTSAGAGAGQGASSGAGASAGSGAGASPGAGGAAGGGSGATGGAMSGAPGGSGEGGTGATGGGGSGEGGASGGGSGEGGAGATGGGAGAMGGGAGAGGGLGGASSGAGAGGSGGGAGSGDIWGVTVPGTRYFVSPDGKDSNPGTEDKPFRTIRKGAEVAQPGDAVLVKEGVYRERVAPPRSGTSAAPIVFKGQPGAHVFIKGSDVWEPTWVASGANVFYGVPDAALFTDDAYWADANPYKVPLSVPPRGLPSAAGFTLGQVFVDGEMYTQMPSLAEAQAADKSWHYDGSSGRIYVHFGGAAPPDQRLVELTTRRQAFAPHLRGLGYLQVSGFIIEHCANQFPKHFWGDEGNTGTASEKEGQQNAQTGCLNTRSGHHWVITGNVIRHANSIGLNVGGESSEDSEKSNQPRPFQVNTGYHLVKDNYIVDNGSDGIMAYATTGLVITGNVIERNNALLIADADGYEQAGFKAHGFKQGRFEGNFLRNNHTYGVWLDRGDHTGARISRNAIIGSASPGVHLENGKFPLDTILVDNNIIVGSKGSGVYISYNGGITVAHNLIANTTPATFLKGTGLTIRDDTLPALADSKNNSFFGNIVVGNTINHDLNYPTDLATERKLDRNVYEAAASARTFSINPFSTGGAPIANEPALVDADLGSHSPGQATFWLNNRAQLTFAEWRWFWAAHSPSFAEQSSVIAAGNSVSFDDAALTVSINANFDPTQIGAVVVPGATMDYAGASIAQDGSARPGPIQSLKQGSQSFVAWTGIAPSAAGVLPW